MTLRRPNLPSEPLRDDLVAWRERRLRDAGIPREQAGTVACDRGYDLHALLDLLDRGCPVDLAMRIVAPLDSPPPST